MDYFIWKSMAVAHSKKKKVNVLECSYTHSGDFLTSYHVGSMYVCVEGLSESNFNFFSIFIII